MQFLQEHHLPVVEYLRAYRGYVRVSEDVEHVQKLRRVHYPAELFHHLAVGQLSPLRDVVHQQMVSDKELHLLRPFLLHPHPDRRLVSQLRAGLGMPFAFGLSAVVQKGREHQRLFVLDAPERLGEFRVRHALAGLHILDFFDSQQGVFVHGVLVIEVVLDERGNRPELRQEPPQYLHAVHVS